MTRKIMFVRAAPLLATLLLAACGGGGYDNPAPQAADPLSEVPATASQSLDGLVDYLGKLPPLNADMRDPIALDAFVPPTSETAEPVPVSG